MQPKRVPYLLILILAVGVFGACTEQPYSSDVIRIGVIDYLATQENALTGQTTANAAQLALQSIEDAGGLVVNGKTIPVELVILSIDDTAEAAVSAARELINQKGVVAIIGPQNSSDAIPAGEIAEAAHVPMICPIATNPLVTQGREYVFRMSFQDDLQGSAMAEFVYHEMGSRRAAVIYNIANTYSSGVAGVFQESFQSLGGEVVAFESYTTGADDFSDQLDRVLQQDADALFLPNYQADVLIQGQQARQMGFSGWLLGGDGWDQHILPDIAAFDGAYMIGHWAMNLQDAQTSAFVDAYQRIFGEKPNDTAALTFDAVNMVFQAIQHQGSFDSQSIRDGLLQMAPYQGVCGQVDFQNSGDPVKSVVILYFTEGSFRFYYQVNP